MLQDLRYALRTIRRAPGFAAIAAGSSALGIGACAVIFAILNFALLTPLPVDDAERLLSLSGTDRRTGEGGNDLSYPDFRDLRQARSFDGVAAYTLMPRIHRLRRRSRATLGTGRDRQLLRHRQAALPARTRIRSRPGRHPRCAGRPRTEPRSLAPPLRS
jgi:hypothetical protein